LHGIGWATVQKMMIDAPSFDIDGEDGHEVIELSESNEQQILNYVNSMM
jgi:hypothetical protein